MSNYINYQLYRTNPKLGGQMKLDLVIGKSGNELSIQDLHITPINYKVPYNRYSYENLTSYTHQENISRFYKNTQGSFYKELTDKKLVNPWPIISKNSYDTHDNTYEMGLRRMRYELYGKQFNFLIPLWLEKVDDLNFDIEVWSSNENGHISNTSDGVQRRLIEKTLKIFGQESENKFSKYIKDYFDYVGISKGNNNCLSIHLDKGSAQISGLNVESGINSVINLPYLVQNLTSRERPLLEFDNMIINQFEDNRMIASQLMNFNICFNLEDIIPSYFIPEFMGGRFGIKIFATINGERLDIVDFFSNYEYISKRECGPISLWSKNGKSTENGAPNVLDYLKDYGCIDLIDKNKIVQSTIHWSLVGNNDYILNVYEGFGGYIKRYIEDESNSESNNIKFDIVKIPHSYNNTPDLLSKKYAESLNNMGWTNYIELDYLNNELLSSISGNIIGYYTIASDFSKEWVNNIKYNIKHIKHDNNPPINLKVLSIFTNEEIVQDPKEFKTLFKDNNYHLTIMTGTAEQLLWKEKEGFLVFISNNRDYLTFKGVLDRLNDIFDPNKKENNVPDQLEPPKPPESYLIRLKDIMNSADPSSNPPMIQLKSTVDLVKTKSPSLSATEHEYIKNDKACSYVLRYSGKIRPTFIRPTDINFNYEYSKDLVGDYNSTKYRLYDSSGLTPKFPSIGYFSIKSIKQDYSIPVINPNQQEFTRFNNNSVILIPDEISIKVKSDKNGVGIESAIDESLEFIDMNKDYVKTLYKTSINFEYADGIDVYNYDVKLKLK